MDDPRSKDHEIYYNHSNGKWCSQLKKRIYNKEDKDFIFLLNILKMAYHTETGFIWEVIKKNKNLHLCSPHNVSEFEFLDTYFNTNDIDGLLYNQNTEIVYDKRQLCTCDFGIELRHINKKYYKKYKEIKERNKTFSSILEYIDHSYDVYIKIKNETNYELKINSLEKIIDDLKKTIYELKNNQHSIYSKIEKLEKNQEILENIHTPIAVAYPVRSVAEEILS